MSLATAAVEALDAMRFAHVCPWCGDPHESHAVGCPALWPVNPWGPCTWCFARDGHAAHCSTDSALINDGGETQ